MKTLASILVIAARDCRNKAGGIGLSASLPCLFGWTLGGGIGQPWLGAPAEAVPFQGYTGERVGNSRAGR